MSNHLAIQIAIDGIHCVVLKNGIVTSENEFLFDVLNDTRIKEQLTLEFESNSIYETDFDEITLSWSSDKTTLVPNAIFSESSPKAIFELCYGKNELDIDYNRISELSVVNIFEIPEWIKRFFVIKFPRVNIQHEGSMLVRQVLNENAFKLKCSIIIYATHFQLIISKHNELIFYSNFEYQSAEDIIYHVMFVLQQKELMNEQGSIELVSGIGATTELIHSIQTGFTKISDIKSFAINTPTNFIQKAHQLCV